VESNIDAPVKIHNRLQYFAKHFRNGRQEDAHELLRYAMEACNHVCVQLHRIVYGSKVPVKQGVAKGASKEEPNTVVKEIFGGLLQSQVKCLSCSTESNKLDDIMDLSLDIVRLGSLNEALCRFFQPEVLDGENKYRCDQYVWAIPSPFSLFSEVLGQQHCYLVFLVGFNSNFNVYDFFSRTSEVPGLPVFTLLMGVR